MNRFIACLSGLFLLSSPLLAQQVDFKIRVQPGTIWSFSTDTDMRQNMQMASTAMPQPMKMQQAMRVVRMGTIEVLTVADGLPTSIRVAFGKDCLTVAEMPMQPKQELPPPYAGKTVTITRQADGSIKHDFPGQLDPQLQTELTKLLEPDTSFHPQKPVNVGDTWKPSKEAIAKMMPLGPDDSVDVTCTLASIKEIDGRRAADIAVIAAISQSPQPGMKMKIELKGDSFIDLDSGITTKADFNGKTTLTGQQQTQDPNTGQASQVTISGDGVMTVHSAAKPQGAGAQADPAIIPAGNPMAPNAVGGNPLAGGVPSANPPASLFAGAFKGDNLSIDLKDAAGKVTGIITLGDQKFDCIAQPAGDKLAGTFVAGDQSFPFTATVTGDTMTLTSGQSTYTLKRLAANPLAKPKPQNPLSPGN